MKNLRTDSVGWGAPLRVHVRAVLGVDLKPNPRTTSFMCVKATTG